MTDQELEIELEAAVIEFTLSGDAEKAKVAQELLRDFQKRQREAIPQPRVTTTRLW